MLDTMLRQQDDRFFADDERLTHVLEWIDAHSDPLKDLGVRARQLRRYPTSASSCCATVACSISLSMPRQEDSASPPQHKPASSKNSHASTPASPGA